MTGLGKFLMGTLNFLFLNCLELEQLMEGNGCIIGSGRTWFSLASLMRALRQQMMPRSCVFATDMEDWVEFLVPGVSLAQTWLLQAFEKRNSR